MTRMVDDQGIPWTEVSSIGDLLVRAATLRPTRDAIVFPDCRLSYAALLDEARTVARGLLALGVRSGDHVGLLMGNSPDYAAGFFGAALLGCVVVPLNVRHRTIELRYIIANADLAVILTSGVETAYLDLPALLSEALGEGHPGDFPWAAAPRLRCVIDAGGIARVGFIDRERWRQLVASAPPASVEAARRRVRVRDPALILYTSGTTAHPKGCVLSNEAVTRGPVERARFRLAAPDGDVTWAAGPLFHIGSLAPFIGSVGAAGTFLCDRFFDAGRALALMRQESATVAWPWFSAIVLGLIDHPDFDAASLSALRHLFLIAPESLVARVQRLFPDCEILQACGMTETAGVFALSDRDEDSSSRALTQGKAAPGVEVRIVDPETGDDCPPAVMGEIWVRGYCVMDGYYAAAEQTRTALTDERWLKTGDLYGRDEQGRLTFRGRVKDMIKVGGENVATMEVESFLCSHPAVKLVEVVGRPDPRLDEVPVAFVELRESATVTADALMAYCKGRIASYKIPRAIHFVTSAEWPMSATKVDKRALRERLKDL